MMRAIANASADLAFCTVCADALLPKPRCNLAENAQGSTAKGLNMNKSSMLLAASALVALLASGSLAAAQDTKGANMRALGDRNVAPAKPGKGASGMKPCPEYGAGFYRLAGSDTCARISGGVASDVGVSGVRR
jgi:hypothetical protein